ncbi:hypothetical protein LTR66_007364 [Elasticomyces elasticus]|nr:hypothetical protein LTR28_006459 [Elasticomyces elasticus]KAK4984329.1 hypothetical protein LTR50_006674 [Elasticomyces elasticus]KAK4988277.1 hypothetical protein LTR66_007364 [Elasticomyces elasticus]
MAAMLGAGDGALGQIPLEQWFFDTPVCTRWWTTATVVTGVLVQCHILTPFQLFYSFRAVFHKNQYWRLISTFVYFGPLSFNLLFHIFFMQRYARMLEDSAASVAHFSWLLLYAAVCLLCIAPLFSMAFLGTTLSSTLVYIWSRRNPDVRLSFLGLLVFRAPWLPWVLIAFSLVLHGHTPKDEIAGVVVGHIWYFFSDIYPSTHHGRRPLEPPRWWIRLFERGPDVPTTEMHAGAMHRDLAAAAAPEVR